MPDDDQPPGAERRVVRVRVAPRRRTSCRRRRLRVRVGDARGRPVQAPGLAAWLARAAPPRAAGFDLSVALVSDGFMRRLNGHFRGVGRATDVLSFPAHWEPRGGVGRATQGGAQALGDIAIATGVARRQAARAGHPYGVELRLLALHGLLHLLGYDHETDDGAMAREEHRLRRLAGLPHGLLERGGDS